MSLVTEEEEARSLIELMGLVPHVVTTQGSTCYYFPGDEPTDNAPRSKWHPVVSHSWEYDERWYVHTRRTIP